MTIAALLAQPSPLFGFTGWTYPVEVSRSDDDSSLGPELRSDSQDRLHLVWAEPGSPDRVCYVRSDDGGQSWPETTDCHGTGEDLYQPAMAVDSADDPHFTWWEWGGSPMGNRRLLYTGHGASGWLWPPQTVVLTTSEILDPAIAVGGGYAHLLWSHGLEPAPDLYYSRKLLSGGGWDAPSIVYDTGPSSLHGRIVPGSDSHVHVTWADEVAAADDITYYISGTIESGGTFWSTPISVSHGVTEATVPDIALGGDGTVHIVFARKITTLVQDLWYVSFPAANPPDPPTPVLIPDSQVRISELWPTYASPAIALDEQNGVHVVWNGMLSEHDDSDRIYYCAYDSVQGWSDPAPVSANDSEPDVFPTITIDGGLVHVAWQEKGLGIDSDIYYSRRFPVTIILPLTFKNYP